MTSTRFIPFLIIGSLGILNQLAFLRLALDLLGIAFMTAQALATLAAMTGNFLLNNIVTYSDRRLRGPALLRGLFSFYGGCAFGTAANVAVATGLFAGGLRWWLAAIAGAAVGAVWNYAISSLLVWRPNIAGPGASPPNPARTQSSAAVIPVSAAIEASD
jgi:dolichol-phosphate mannosyltransferase